MVTKVVVVLLKVMIAVVAVSHQQELQTRSLINLYSMLAKHVPCESPYFPIPYGCWCGITGNVTTPPKPVDDFDAMCMAHDNCYEKANDDHNCTAIDDYIKLYKWDYLDGQIVCRQDNKPCQKSICNCDKTIIDGIADKINAGTNCPLFDPGCPSSEERP